MRVMLDKTCLISVLAPNPKLNQQRKKRPFRLRLVSRNSLQPHCLCQPGPSYTNKPSNQPGSLEDYAWIWVDIGFAEGMRRLSFLFSPQNISSSSFLLSRIGVSLFLRLSVSLLLSLTFSLNHRDKSSGLLAFSSSSEKKKKGGGGRGRKAPLSVPLLLLHGTGRTKAFPDRPDRPYLYPAVMSSPCVFTTPPCTPFSFRHNPLLSY